MSQNPYSTPNYMPPGQQPPVDEGLTTIDWVLCALCSGIACIIGIVRLVQGKTKSGGMMIGISIAFAIFWNIVSVIVSMALRANQ